MLPHHSPFKNVIHVSHFVLLLQTNSVTQGQLVSPQCMKFDTFDTCISQFFLIYLWQITYWLVPIDFHHSFHNYLFILSKSSIQFEVSVTEPIHVSHKTKWLFIQNVCSRIRVSNRACVYEEDNRPMSFILISQVAKKCEPLFACIVIFYVYFEIFGYNIKAKFTSSSRKNFYALFWNEKIPGILRRLVKDCCLMFLCVRRT